MHHRALARGLAVALAFAVLGAGTPRAAAESAAEFPTRPVSLIVPFQAGTTADLLLRGMAESASRHLGQPVVVDNRVGGSATLGPAQMAATSKPDGYTISQMPIPVFRVPVMQKATYDPVKDFTYIIQLGGYTLGGVVPASSPFKKWQDVIDFARANPGKMTYTTIGPATTNAIAMELMARHSGVQFTHVPSRGGGESIAALMGGHMMMMVESPSWAPLVASGELRLLMLLMGERNKKWPGVPVITELGYPFYYDSPFGLAGPKGMDPVVVRKLHDAFKKAYDEPKIAELFDKFDFTRRYLSTEAYAKSIPPFFANEKASLEKVGLARKE